MSTTAQRATTSLRRQFDGYTSRFYVAPKNRYVCASCVTDAHLAKVLTDKSDSHGCSYCGSLKAAPIDVLLDEIVGVIVEDYDDPADELPYESREGGYQGIVYDNYEILDELDPWTDSGTLTDDVAGSISERQWCKKNYFELDQHEALRYGWNEFANQIKHRTRHLFFSQSDESSHESPGSIPPDRMLQELGRLFRHHDLFRALPVGSVFFRVRITDHGPLPESVADLGPVPRRLARYSNRMSPAGVPMFYAALTERTAVLETFDPKRKTCKTPVITVGEFRCSKELVLLDLVRVPMPYSCFDRENRHERKQVAFLWDLRRELAKPIDKDGREHMEYIPTQVVAEYVRHRLTHQVEGRRIDGILYPSSRDGGESIVVFAEADDCGPPDPRELTGDEVRAVIARAKFADAFLHLVGLRHTAPQYLGRYFD